MLFPASPSDFTISNANPYDPTAFHYFNLQINYLLTINLFINQCTPVTGSALQQAILTP